MARSLAQQRTRIIGMVALNIANPFWPAVVRGVEDAVRARGYELLLANSDDDPEKEAQDLRLFLAKRVDGILLTKACGRLPADLARAAQGLAASPVVQLMRLGTGLRSDVVTVDEEGGAYEAVDPPAAPRLHADRHAQRPERQHLAAPPRRLPAGARRRGIAGSIRSSSSPSDFRVEAGYESGIALLRRRPDAVFVANYLMAVGFMQALRQYQLRCPEDIGIVTCDDHPWLDAFSPRLTTINLPKYEIGRRAAELLLDAIQPPAAAPKRRGGQDRHPQDVVAHP